MNQQNYYAAQPISQPTGVPMLDARVLRQYDRCGFLRNGKMIAGTVMRQGATGSFYAQLDDGANLTIRVDGSQWAAWPVLAPEGS